MKNRFARIAARRDGCWRRRLRRKAPRRTYPPSGFDLSAIDRSTKPGDDFFQYANGKYLARSVIPADRPTVSRRFEMTDRMEANLHQLLQEAAQDVGEQPADVRGKAGAFYASFMDEPQIERIGARRDRARARRDPLGLDARPSSPALMGQSAYDFYPAIAAPVRSTATSRRPTATPSISTSRASACPTAIII